MNTKYPSGIISSTIPSTSLSTASGKWTMERQMQAKTANIWPTSYVIPTSTPTIGTPTITSTTTVSVAFTPPNDPNVVSYTVLSTPGNFTATGSSSPIVITAAFAANISYTFQVRCTNPAGTGTASSSSNSIIPNAIVGQALFTTVGTTAWTCPVDVTSVCVVCVGGGGGGGVEYGHGGGGGGLIYANNVPVIPGNIYTVIVGRGGTVNTTVSAGPGGTSSFSGIGITGQGTYTFGATGGGNGGIYNTQRTGGGSGAGGGAAGYSGNGASNPGANSSAGGSSASGGLATVSIVGYTFTTIANAGGAGGYASSQPSFSTAWNAPASNGSGGGGSGGAYAYGTGTNNYSPAGGGGGVGLLGLGSTGAGGVGIATGSGGGGGGSGGSTGNGGTAQDRSGGTYGGGAAGAIGVASSIVATGGQGAVRIIWGIGRAFPSTLTTDQ